MLLANVGGRNKHSHTYRHTPYTHVDGRGDGMVVYVLEDSGLFSNVAR